MNDGEGERLHFRWHAYFLHSQASFPRCFARFTANATSNFNLNCLTPSKKGLPESLSVLRSHLQAMFKAGDEDGPAERSSTIVPAHPRHHRPMPAWSD